MANITIMKIKLFLYLFVISTFTSVLIGFFPTVVSAAPGDVDRAAIDKLIVCSDPKNGGNDKCKFINTCIDSASSGTPGGECGAIIRIGEYLGRDVIKKTIDSCVLKNSNTAAKCTETLKTCTAGSVGTGQLTKATADECQKKVASGNLATATVPPANTADPEAEQPSSCVIKGIGWLICPVVDFGAKLVDGSYTLVESLLYVQPLLTNGSAAGVYNAWSAMRTFANVAFVIAFMVIIFSQLTSVGVSNYGLKKLLPKVVIAVILVNISYWVCAVLVDLSNIAGASLRGIIENIDVGGAKNTPFNSSVGANGGVWETLSSNLLKGGAAVAITGVAAATVLYGSFSILIPLLIAAALAIFTVFIVLTLRQALIILLIAVAPLAFVAYLLPNTEGLFKKWWALFKTLLLMYPIIALIFGVSAIASKIVMGSSPDIPVQLMGAGISIIPLFITPLVMRTAGGFLNRIGGFVNNPNKGPVDRARKGVKTLDKDYKGMLKSRGLQGKFTGIGGATRVGANFRSARANRERELGRTETKFNAESASSDNQSILGVVGTDKINQKFGTNLGSTQAQRMAIGAEPGADQRAMASAEAQLEKINIEDVNASQAIIKNANIDFDQMKNLAMGGITSDGKFDARKDSVLQQAAIRQVVATNNQDGLKELFNSSTSWSSTGDEEQDKRGRLMQQTFADTLASSNTKPAYVGQAAIENIRKGTGTTDQKTLIDSALKSNAFSPVSAATGDKDTMETILKEINAGNVSEDGMEKFFAANRTALDDPRLNTQISKNRAVVEKIAPKVTASIDPTSLKAMSESALRSTISTAGGNTALSDGDVSRIITATRGNGASATLHGDMMAERMRRT